MDNKEIKNTQKRDTSVADFSESMVWDLVANIAMVGEDDNNVGQKVEGFMSLHLNMEYAVTEKMKMEIGFTATTYNAGNGIGGQNDFFTDDRAVSGAAQVGVELESASLDYALTDNWTLKSGFYISLDDATGNLQIRPLGLTSLITFESVIYASADGGNIVGENDTANTVPGGRADGTNDQFAIRGRSLGLSYENPDAPIQAYLSLFSRSTVNNQFNGDDILTNEGIDTISLLTVFDFDENNAYKFITGIMYNDGGNNNSVWKYKLSLEYKFSDKMDFTSAYGFFSQPGNNQSQFSLSGRYNLDDSNVVLSISNEDIAGNNTSAWELVYTRNPEGRYKNAYGYTNKSRSGGNQDSFVFGYISMQLKEKK